MVNLYVYDLADNQHVATIIGTSNQACEAKAADLNYDADGYGWTYSPAFGFHGGLVENSDAEEFQA